MHSLGTIARGLNRPPSDPAPSSPAGRAVFLTIGLNLVDPVHYGYGVQPLRSAEADAIALGRLLVSRGYQPWGPGICLGRDATRKNVGQALDGLAEVLMLGDSAVVCYAGHGAQIPDSNGDEPERQDEAWCLYDGEWVDDETRAVLVRLRPGVRLTIYSDCCHAATVSRAEVATGCLLAAAREDIALAVLLDQPELPRYRGLDEMVARDLYAAHAGFYDAVQRVTAPLVRCPVRAEVVVIGACQDRQLAGEGAEHGILTERVLAVLGSGFRGTWQQLWREVGRRMPQSQTPSLDFVGRQDGLYRRAFEGGR